MAIQQEAHYTWLVLLLPSLFLWKPSHAAADSFDKGETFSPQRNLTSSNGDFVFGFFNLSDNSSSNPRWYVGIWYANVDPLTVAWVANRDSPVSAEQLSFSFLTITNQSSLQLTTNGSTIWSTKPSGKLAAAAKMQNNGNLVLFAAENKSEALWQSFDEPGDTLLPSMKIGTNQSQCAWQSLWNPATGLFCFHLTLEGSLQLTWNRSVVYWDSGVWDGRKFSNMPEMDTPQSPFTFSLVKLGSYKYFVFAWADERHQGPLSRSWLHPSGQLQELGLGSTGNWSVGWTAPKDTCVVYATCGAFATCNSNNLSACSCLAGYRPRYQRAWDALDWSAGCVRNTPFACAKDDGFVKLQAQSLPGGGIPTNGLISARSCRDECLANCSCTAFATNATNGSCFHWFGDLLNLRSNGADTNDGVSLFLRLNSRDVPRSPNSRSTSRKVGLYAGVAAAAGLSIFVAVVAIWGFRRRQAKNKTRASAALVRDSLRVFSHKELQAATGDFSQCIGAGGFGSVFKGTLADAARTEVAVKKLEGSRQGEKEFRTEVATVGQVQHVNVVRLLGFCSEHQYRLLVYEYVRNGSLASWLFGAGPGLDWKSRFSVAVGAARALEYLHEQCRERIIHCDIKPENILLDAQFNAKVADFGLAKLLGRDFSRALTTMRGTRGYLAPEWLSGDPITPKADVYSFGMTLLEIVTGRRNVGGVPSSGFFAAKAAAEISSGNATAVLDRRLAEDPSVEEEEVRRVACMALWCVQEDEAARPHMRDVRQVLQGVKEPPQVAPPVPPSMQAADVDSKASSSVVFFWEHESYRDNDDGHHHEMPS